MQIAWHWSDINYWAVIVATIVRMAVGFLWYSLIFPKVWMNLIGMKQGDARGNAAVPMIGVLILSFVFSLVLAVLMQMTNAMTFQNGVECGIIVSLIVAVSIAVNFLFENRSQKLYWITVGYHTIAIILSALILAVWHITKTM